MDRRELRQYEAYKSEAQSLREENRFLRYDRDGYRRDWYRTRQRVNTLGERVEKLEAENRRLRRRVKELTAAACPPAPAREPPPPFVKPPARGRR
jgi:hypothetical protein